MYSLMADTLPVLHFSILYSLTIMFLPNADAPYEKIMTFELGYGLTMSILMWR